MPRGYLSSQRRQRRARMTTAIGFISRSASAAVAAGVAFLFCVIQIIVIPAIPGGLPPAEAQDIIGATTQYTSGAAGPYTVEGEARLLPSRQAAIHIVRVSDAATGLPVADVRVQVLTSLQGSDHSGYAHAISPNVPGLYSATVELAEPGIWETTLLIEPPEGGEYGVGSFTFEVAVPTAERTAGFVFLGVAVVLAAGASYLVWQIRRNQRERAAREIT